MKRFSVKLMALALCCALALSLAACDMDLEGLLSGGKPGNEEFLMAEIRTDTPVKVPGKVPVEAEKEIPNGWTEYNNGMISLAIPEDWEIQPGQITVIYDPSNSGKNFTLASEMKSDIYKTMTPDGYMDLVGAAYASSGLVISDVTVEQTYTGSGEPLTVITQSTTTNGITMHQTLMVIASGSFNCVVTVTQLDSGSDLVDTVIETLRSVD